MAVTGTPTAGNDVLQSDGAGDSINGLAGNDVLIGNGGDDTLNGGEGADTLLGGEGNDLYIVDNTGDVVVEDNLNGVDTIRTSVSYTAATGVEILTAANAAGGAISAGLVLNGNNIANRVSGSLGADVLYGGDDDAGVAADTLIGLGGNDTYIIREGADDVLIEAADDAVNGTTGGNDTVIVVASQTRTAYSLQNSGTSFTVDPAGNGLTGTVNGLGNAQIENLIASDANSTLALALAGNTAVQTIVGNAGINRLFDGGYASATQAGDTLIGLAGDDRYFVTDARTQVVDTSGFDQISIGYAAQNIGAGPNALVVPALAANAGTYVFTGDIESIDAIDSPGVQINITGGAVSQTIRGNSAINILNGGGGDDTLIGLGGNDTYIIDSLSDRIVDLAGEGTDYVFVSGSYALNYADGAGVGAGTQVEYLLAAGTNLATQAGQGDGTFNLNALNTTATSDYFVGSRGFGETIFGNAGDNILNGFANGGNEANNGNLGSTDTLYGLGGNDTYRVYQQGDVVVEDRGGGTMDYVYTSADYSLALNDAAVAGLTFTSSAFNAAGTLVTTTRNVSSFINGPTEIEVLSAAQQSAGTAGINNLVLTGNTFGQIIAGNFGNNIISDGGTVTPGDLTSTQGGGFNGARPAFTNFGAGSNVAVAGNAAGSVDQLAGLRGDDFYFVTSQSTTVNENEGEGTDHVYVTLATPAAGGAAFYGLIDNGTTNGSVEFITVGGSNNVDIRGNRFNQTIFGNAAGNTLDGAGGADTLVGGDGNDVYVVNSTTVQPVIIEVDSATGGVDRVVTSVSFTLAATNAAYVADDGTQVAGGTPLSVEQITVANAAGTEAINLTGNSVNQTIVGNNGANVLNGGGGVDTLIGLGGNDTYVVDSASDVVIEAGGGGTDTVQTSVTYALYAGQEIEVLQATGATGITLTGNAFAQTLIGNGGANRLQGLLGNDTLTGGAGNDTFAFHEFGTANADIITDFGAGDVIALNSNAFTALQGGFTADNFAAGAQAADGNDFIVYNQATGQLFYDQDGSGTDFAAQLIATVTPGTILTSANIQIVNEPIPTPPAVPIA